MFKKFAGRSKIQLFAILLVCLLPIVLSYFFYFFAKPQGGMSYGHLLEVKRVTQTPVKLLDGQARSLEEVQEGKWALVMIAHAKCDQACHDKLFAMRQYRLGQGLESSRIKRIWIIDDQEDLNQKLPNDLLEGVDIVRASQLEIDHPSVWDKSIFLIDPQGNQVMRYQQDQEHRKIMNEIGKLLKHNQGMG